MHASAILCIYVSHHVRKCPQNVKSLNGDVILNLMYDEPIHVIERLQYREDGLFCSTVIQSCTSSLSQCSVAQLSSLVSWYLIFIPVFCSAVIKSCVVVPHLYPSVLYRGSHQVLCRGTSSLSQFSVAQLSSLVSWYLIFIPVFCSTAIKSYVVDLWNQIPDLRHGYLKTQRRAFFVLKERRTCRTNSLNDRPIHLSAVCAPLAAPTGRIDISFAVVTDFIPKWTDPGCLVSPIGRPVHLGNESKSLTGASPPVRLFMLVGRRFFLKSSRLRHCIHSGEQLDLNV
ncbi:hypothetical protein PoB_003736500 [Plakobranchus ocellatus]|uniref:Uncharacterized protein n=1 Tax=Plakobranchus ocellatus TaxID=259542 RepID=A0AAV4AVE1_9GAST|nr:hypothetical protein PoB_003736500 [Plakobranchus ocellatus]